MAQDNSRDHITIYERAHGLRPYDEMGRRFHIHHKDGNHSNNEVDNLIALSAQDHYQIHMNQGDWGAALFIAGNFLDFTGEELSELARKGALKRIEEGNHNFVGDNNPARRKSAAGTHHWSDENYIQQRIDDGSLSKWSRKGNKKRIDNGTHNLLGPSQNQKRIDEGTHNFIGGELARANVKKQLEGGTHPTQLTSTCPHCQKIGPIGTMGRHHFDYCKLAPNRKIRPKVIYTKKHCEHCHKDFNPQMFSRWHGNNCKKKEIIGDSI